MEQKTIQGNNLSKTVEAAATGEAEGAIVGSMQKIGLGGAMAGVAAMGAMSLAPPLLAAHNKAKLGPVTYEPGMQRMTKPFNRGVVQSMMEAANGDPHIFSDMAKRVVKTGNNPVSNVLDDFGVDGQFISAFYGMGG
jgi:hypothetical protein